jgi:hypothetical protein
LAKDKKILPKGRFHSSKKCKTCHGVFDKGLSLSFSQDSYSGKVQNIYLNNIEQDSLEAQLIKLRINCMFNQWASLEISRKCFHIMALLLTR